MAYTYDPIRPASVCRMCGLDGCHEWGCLFAPVSALDEWRKSIRELVKAAKAKRMRDGAE